MTDHIPELIEASCSGDYMVILEAFGTGLIVEPYIPNIVLAGNLVSKLGTENQKEATKIISQILKQSSLFLSTGHYVWFYSKSTFHKYKRTNYWQCQATKIRVIFAAGVAQRMVF